MIVTLYTWGIVAMAYNSSERAVVNSHDWKNLGNFSTVQTCEDAAKVLAVQNKIFRCVVSAK